MEEKHNVHDPRFEDKLRDLLNSCSMENGSDTPDWILAMYLSDCLNTFNKTVNARTTWYSADPKDDVGVVEPQN